MSTPDYTKLVQGQRRYFRRERRGPCHGGSSS